MQHILAVYSVITAEQWAAAKATVARLMIANPFAYYGHRRKVQSRLQAALEQICMESSGLLIVLALMLRLNSRHVATT